MSGKDSTYFFKVNSNKRLYRQLTFGKLKVFDALFNVNERYGLINPSECLIEVENKIFKPRTEKEFLDTVISLAPEKCSSVHVSDAIEVIKILNGKL